MEASRTEYAADLRLAQEAARGTIESWHQFITRYSGLIFSIVRRYLPNVDEDGKRDAYVLILEYLCREGLAKYDGRAALSTWVMAVTRSRCLDILRSRYGRRRDPSWLQSLRKRDREIYRLYFINNESYPAIAAFFRRRGQSLSVSEFAKSLERVESKMDRKLRTRMAYDLQARSVGAVSGRLLEFLDHLRLQQEEISETLRPDFELLHDQTRMLLQEVEACVKKLDAQERHVIQLHFYKKLGANQIAAELELQGPRRVYTLIDRAIATLRSMLAVWLEGSHGSVSSFSPYEPGHVPRTEETGD